MFAASSDWGITDVEGTAQLQKGIEELCVLWEIRRDISEIVSVMELWSEKRGDEAMGNREVDHVLCRANSIMEPPQQQGVACR